MHTNKFVRKPFYVEAVQVTSANIEDVANWCGGTVEEAKPDRDLEQGRVPDKYVKVKVYRPMSDRQTMAFVGDWVLFAGKGYKVYTDPAFQKSFELTDGSLEPHSPGFKPDLPYAPKQNVETVIEKGTEKRIIAPSHE